MNFHTPIVIAALAILSVTAFAAEEAGRRLTPAEITALTQTGAGAGTSGVVGIQTIVLTGNPTQAGLYTLRLTAPPNTRIEAHTHKDSRSAIVQSGTWYFGYGPRFEAGALKTLPAGSFYTEPPGVAHFAETRGEPVVLIVTGFGPTDTVFPGAAAAPR